MASLDIIGAINDGRPPRVLVERLPALIPGRCPRRGCPHRGIRTVVHVSCPGLRLGLLDPVTGFGVPALGSPSCSDRVWPSLPLARLALQRVAREPYACALLTQMSADPSRAVLLCLWSAGRPDGAVRAPRSLGTSSPVSRLCAVAWLSAQVPGLASARRDLEPFGAGRSDCRVSHSAVLSGAPSSRCSCSQYQAIRLMTTLPWCRIAGLSGSAPVLTHVLMLGVSRAHAPASTCCAQRV